MTTIAPCTCHHEFQDEKYGPGNRVHNIIKSDSGTKGRCTVCGKERDVRAREV